MSYTEPEFRQACLQWLASKEITTIESLADAHILIDAVTQSDPDYFSAASLVLPGRPNEPNLDALAQLARLLLRYFEQALNKQLARDYIPSVASLASPPFDDLWRLLALAVAVTLLGEHNNAEQQFDSLDAGTKHVLQDGIEGMWEDAEDSAQGVMGGSSIVSHVVASPADSIQRVSPRLESSNAASADSFASVRTSPQQFQSAYSSFPNQQTLSHGDERLIDADEVLRYSAPSIQQSAAVIDPVIEGTASIESMRSSDLLSRFGQLTGFDIAGSALQVVESDSEVSSDSEEESDDEEASETESYESEFSQDLATYQPGDGILGYGKPSPHAVTKYIFVLNTVAYHAVGIYLLLSTRTPSSKSPYFKDYRDMADAVLQVIAVSLASVVASIAWIQALRHQTRKVVWMTTLAVPLVGLSMAVWAGSQVLAFPGVEGMLGYKIRTGIVSAVSLILAVRFALYVRQQRQDIERSVAVVKLASDVLAETRELFGFAVLLLAMYGVFAIASGIYASRLPLVQSLMGSAGRPGAYGLPAYLAVSFAWTSAVALQVLRTVVSIVVSQWYFHRHDPGEPPALQTLQAAAVSALTRQLGTVVVSATLLLAVKTMHVAELLVRWAVSLLRVIPVSLVSLALGRPVYFIESWNSYSAVYAALTGKGFFESSSAVTRLLRKHHLLHSSVVGMLKSSLTSYALLVSVVLGYLLGTKAMQMLSMHAVLVAVAGSALPFAVLQLVTHVVSCTVEALVVCYAVDLEVDACHSIKVAEAMSLA
ncbi:hypothetical protein EC988_000214 [Linderina pennispora]|nr:hypothetical protein EC988_000214 [Linderina pennispora]